MREFAVAVVLIIAVACASEPSRLPGHPAERAELVGRDLVSSVVEHGGESVPLVAGGQFEIAALVVRFAETRIGASGGCNWFGADRWDVVNGRLEVEADWSGTLIGCGQAPERQDRWLTSFLKSGPHILVDAERYFFISGETVVIFLEGDVEQL